MDFIIDFYKNLDTVNLFIFWGVIIVVLLLLIFSIVIANKNKKLEKIIESKGINIEEYDDSCIPTLKNEDLNNKNDEGIVTNVSIATENNGKNEISNNQDFFKSIENDVIDKKDEIKSKTLESEKFIVEEHIIDYKNNELQSDKIINDDSTKIGNNIPKEEITMPNKPYQKNILKEMSLNQTSPIGIIKKEINKEEERAQDLHKSFDDNNITELNNIGNITSHVNNDTHQTTEEAKHDIPYKKGNYLEELSKRNSSIKDEITRTEYELKQEEDAIISYDELMKKKDRIKMIDEEDAIISINELLKKNKQDEKLYNLNNEEDNDNFINELKNFRSDL